MVILGHSSCGAVSAALDHLSDPAEEPSEIVSLLYQIEPALSGIRKDLNREDQVAEAVKRNVDLAVRRLSRVPDMRKSLKAGRIKIVGAVYNMGSGKVELLPYTSPFCGDPGGRHYSNGLVFMEALGHVSQPGMGCSVIRSSTR